MSPVRQLGSLLRVSVPSVLGLLKAGKNAREEIPWFREEAERVLAAALALEAVPPDITLNTRRTA